jgi:predicted GNAT family acetyltransferase
MSDDAVQAVVDELVTERPDLIGVIGVLSTAAAFAECWQQATGATATPGVDQRLYSLTDVIPAVGVPGRARPAAPADRHLLIDWSQAFHDEAVPDHPHENLADIVDRRIGDGTYVIWEVDGLAVSFAGVSLPSAGVSRIGPVYTPPAERRHGYASAVTAAASRRALDGGAAHCMLYTDLANPTSNAIYQALGYRPVCDAREYVFSYPAGGAAG